MRRGHLRLVPPNGELMPLTRGECVDGPRPCKWTHCRYSLASNMTRNGLEIHWRPEDHPERESCALDVADRGGVDQIEVARALGVSRETVRQIEAKGLRKMAR